jgi:hypothetical protein
MHQYPNIINPNLINHNIAYNSVNNNSLIYFPNLINNPQYNQQYNHQQ